MDLTVASLRHAIASILAVLETEHERLTELDGQIGDGDLGITLIKAFRELDRIKGDLPDDLGQALMQGAGAVAKVSSSSFGTLLATSMMAVAKTDEGRHASAAWSEVPGFLEKAVRGDDGARQGEPWRQDSARCGVRRRPGGRRAETSPTRCATR